MEATKQFLDSIAENTTFTVGELLPRDNPHYDTIGFLSPVLLSLDKRFRRTGNKWRRLTAEEIQANLKAHFRLKYHLLLTNPDILK